MLVSSSQKLAIHRSHILSRQFIQAVSPSNNQFFSYNMPVSSALRKVFDNADQWTVTAKEYKELSKAGATQPVTDAVVSIANSLLPFSQATGIFDDGCGTGVVTETLIREHGSSIPPSARLLAGDFSAGMIATVEQTRAEKAATDPTWGRLETRIIDATDLAGIPDGSLSHIVSSLCIYAIDFDKALKECYRVLAPGGVISLSGLGAVPWFDALEGVDAIRPEAGGRFELSEEFKNVENLTRLLESHGFSGVQSKTVEMPMRLPPSPVDFYKRFLRGTNPGIVGIVGGWTEDEIDRAAELAEVNIRKKYGEGQVTLLGLGVIAGGKK